MWYYLCMEILLTLCRKDLLDKIDTNLVDGVIFGSVFSNKFHYDLIDIKEINIRCKELGLKRYISIDSMICESDKASLYHYFDLLVNINPDGIYFADLGIIPVATSFGLGQRLIYDPVTLISNSIDAAFYLKQNIGVVLNRELTLEENRHILAKFEKKCDMQIFGHLRMSISKRKFLSNYFAQIEKNIDIREKDDISLIEENRKYHLPIRETRYGTEIYSDNILCLYNELPELKNKINRAIIDSDFVEDKLILRFLDELKILNEDNSKDLFDKLVKDYPNVDSGFMYKKVMTTKGECDE